MTVGPDEHTHESKIDYTSIGGKGYLVLWILVCCLALGDIVIQSDSETADISAKKKGQVCMQIFKDVGSLLSPLYSSLQGCSLATLEIRLGSPGLRRGRRKDMFCWPVVFLVDNAVHCVPVLLGHLVFFTVFSS